MDVSYIGIITQTTSIYLYGIYNSEDYVFLIHSGDVKVENGIVSIYDFAEQQWFDLTDANFSISSIRAGVMVLPTYYELQNYDKFVIERAEEIKTSNDELYKQFLVKRDNIKYIDKQRPNINSLKHHINVRDIFIMKQFGVTDLGAFQQRTDDIIIHMVTVCSVKLQQTGELAISKLLTEREKFTLEGDTDSIEEVDIIIDMITEAVNTTSFETFQTIDDVYTLWPPILLPVPFNKYL
jgi:hypothetical protein